MHNQCRSMSIGMAKSTGDLVPHFKENQMEKFIEWTLAIVIFGGIGVLLAWRDEMNTEQLRRKARELYNNKEVPQEVNQYNQRKWIRSVLKLGDKWLLAKQVSRIQ